LGRQIWEYQSPQGRPVFNHKEKQMPKFQVSLPIVRGYQVFTVESENAEDAIEAVLSGQYDSDDGYVGVEVVYDSEDELNISQEEIKKYFS
jgi:hypothetical protein